MNRTTMSIRSSAFSAVGLALLLAGPGTANAQIAIDDFSDGNDDGWTHFDYTEGESFGPAVFEVSDEAYRIASEIPHQRGDVDTLCSLWDDSAANESFRNGYFQARVRADNSDTVVGLVMRAGTDQQGRLQSYTFGASANYGVVVIRRQNGGTADFIGPMGDVGFGPGHDWIFKAGAFDNRLEFKAWRADRSEPALPQVTVSDSLHSAVPSFDLVSLDVELSRSVGASRLSRCWSRLLICARYAIA